MRHGAGPRIPAHYRRDRGGRRRKKKRKKRGPPWNRELSPACVLTTMGEKARPQCYFEVEINREPVGRIVFQLFSDVCPKTCKNFLCLCTGEKGTGKVTGKKLYYKGSTFHRVVKNFMIQGGDFSEGNGKGGESIYGGYFKDENFILKHDRAFLLSMANRGKHTNGSQFFITTKPAPHLDGIHVVFGLVISGFEVIEKIENLKTDAASRPYADVRVTDCGLLVAKPTKDVTEKVKKDAPKSEESEGSSKASSPSSSSTSETSSSESAHEIEKSRKRKRKRRTKIKHTKRRRKEPSKREATREKRHSKQLRVSSEKNKVAEDKDSVAKREKPVVRPEEIPPVPEHRFLLRRDAPAPKSQPEQKLPNVSESENNDHHKALLSKSGRKIRGRGTIRYHTPPRSRSCSETEENEESSETPPHWKEEMQRLRAYKSPTGEKWSKGDKLDDRLSSRWDDGSLSSRSSSWSRDEYHSASRERESHSKNRKKEKKVKHKKKAKKTKHLKKAKPLKKGALTIPKKELLQSKRRKRKPTGDKISAITVSPSASSKGSSKKDWSVSDKEQRSSVHSSKDSPLNSRSRSRSYSRGALRSRTVSNSSSYSRSCSRNRSRTKSRSRNRTRSGSRSNSHSKSSSSAKRLNTVSQSPKVTALPLVETKNISITEPVKPAVHQIDKLSLAPVAADPVPVIPLSDSPPPSRWKPGQKPWKPSYERVQAINAKTVNNLTKQSKNFVGETKGSSYRKHHVSSDSEHSDYSGKSSGYRRKSKYRSSRSRSYSRSYSRSISHSSSSSRAELNSPHTASSSYDRSSSYDSNNDSSSSRKSFKKVASDRKSRSSKSPHQKDTKQERAISPKSSRRNSCSDSSSSYETQCDNKELLKTMKLLNKIKNTIDTDMDQEIVTQESNVSQQVLNAEPDSDHISREKEGEEYEKSPELTVESGALNEKPLELPMPGNLSISEKTEVTKIVEDSLLSSGKEEGEASSESDTEEVSQPKAEASPSRSENNPENLAKTPPSSSSSQETIKNKSKKHKHRSTKKSGKKTLSRKGREKSKKKKEKKHKVQKRKQTFHWQPPLEFNEEEEEEELVTLKPDKHKIDERQGQVLDKSNVESSQLDKSDTNETPLKTINKPGTDQDKSVCPVLCPDKSVESKPLSIKSKKHIATGKDIQTRENHTKYTTNHTSETPGRSQSTAVHVNSSLPSTSIAINAVKEEKEVKEEISVSNQPALNNTTSLEKINLENSDSLAVDNKWKPVQGPSLSQMVKPQSMTIVTATQQENKSQGLRIEIKSKNKVRPGSLFDEVRKTARLNQRPRNQESSSEEASSSQDGKSRSVSETRSRSKSRSASRGRKSSRSYSWSRSRSKSYSYSSRSSSYSRSRSRRPSRYRSRSRSRSYGSYRSYTRTHSRSRSRSSYDRRRRTRSRSYTTDSYYSRSRSHSRSRRSRSYDRRSRSRRSYDSDSGSDRSYSRHRRRS